MKFEATQLHCLSDVFVTAAVDECLSSLLSYKRLVGAKVTQH